MPKTIFAASAEELFEQLRNVIRGINSYGIIVPQAHFLKQLLRFYPNLPREHLYTPGSLLQACGLEPVPNEILSFEVDFDEFCDPSLWEVKNDAFDAWLKQQSYAFWDDASKTGETLFERCIFFGSFSNRQRQKLMTGLKSRCREFVILQRTFSKNAENKLTDIHLYPHRSAAEGYAWAERMKAEHPNACGILLPSAESLAALFRKPSPRSCAAWSDWQEQGTVGTFLAYVQTQTDSETLQDWQKDCDDAFRACRTERFDALRKQLREQGKAWAEPFARCDWPASAAVGTYVTLLQIAKPPFEAGALSALQTCPSVVTKRAFFAYLRRVLRYRSGLEGNFLLWEEAVYLPVKEGFVPQAISINIARDANIAAWMTETIRRGGSLHAGIPLRDRDGEPLQPLINFLEPPADGLSGTDGVASQTVPTSTATDNVCMQAIAIGADGSRMYKVMSNAYAMSVLSDAYEKSSKPTVLWFPKREEVKKISGSDVLSTSKNDATPKNALRVPTAFIRLSCKEWEYFYLCPRKTWLEKILKTVPVSLHLSTSKALFLGDGIHDNLCFDRPPCDLDEWKASIHQRSDDRWECLCRYDSNASLLRQRYQRALEFSLKMATACEEFLSDGWKLYSEYVLPRESGYSGRIDLLAIHTERQKVVVIDYKSGSNVTFTVRGLESGYGRQLLLYGQALQTLYPKYKTELRMVLRTGKSTTLPLDKLREVSAEMNAWMDKFQQSGVYEPLPEEKSETLPLAFCSGKSARF